MVDVTGNIKKMEITDNIHSLAQQLFQLIQHQEMEITINQQTIQYQDTRKILQLRTQKKTENTVDKIIAKARAIYQIHTAFQDRPEILLNKAMDIVISNQLGKITNAQFEELQTQITQLVFLKSDLAKLSVLVEFIVKFVGSIVKVFKQFVNGDLVSSTAFGLRVNKVLVYISIFSKAIAPQKYTKVATIGTIKKDHFSYRRALFQYFRKDLGIPAEITITKSDFCNYINAKINSITETLCIVNINIKHYVTKQFPQVQQPVESNPEKYEYGPNNPTTAQNKSTVNKKPRSETPQTLENSHLWNQHSWTKLLGEYELLFGNLTPTAGQIEGNMSTWEQPPAQNPAELASSLIEKTVILQLSGSSDKGKQPALAPKEHLNTQTPTLLNITSNTLPINQIMAYQDIAKLKKFLEEKNNVYL
ncbi:hypothetical protein G9A89_006635 [Geosiphon pyriformis]|nr:hypothetical protein G9A89_006635 [Geosiphon pyriformis]